MRINFKLLIVFIICVLLGIFIRSYIAQGSTNETQSNVKSTEIESYLTAPESPDWETIVQPQLQRRAEQIEKARLAEEARLAAIKAQEISEALQRAQAAKANIVPKPAPKAIQTAVNTSDMGVWDRLSLCESGGRWDYNGSSGFDGGLQFSPATWNAMATDYAFAWQAPREVQIAAAQRLQARSGWGQWPACARKLGLI